MRLYRGPVQMAVLDWAGTTVDYGCFAPTMALVELFRRRGIEISIPQARAPMGLAKLDHVREIARMPEIARAWEQTHGKPCTEDDVLHMYEQDFKTLQIECIAQYTGIIPGTLDAIAALRKRDIRIGTTTGYFTEAAEAHYREAEREGYIPDVNICASDVPGGRPEPWMIFHAMEKLRIFPPEAVVAVGDTPVDIEAGLNARTWTIGISLTGNEVGLSEEELAHLPKHEILRRDSRARQALKQAGAHLVISSIAELPAAILDIENRMRAGVMP